MESPPFYNIKNYITFIKVNQRVFTLNIALNYAIIK